MNKVAKNTIWNLIGNITYFFSQWLITVLVVRISESYEEAGILSVAMSVSLIFSTVSSFSMRYFQVSDINGKFTDGEYVSFRIITCLFSMIFLIGFLAIVNYDIYTSLAVICFMLLKIVESLVDVFQGIFQKQWRLDIACRSMVVRGILNVVVFSVVEALLKNLVISLLVTSLISLVCAIFLDFRPGFKNNDIKVRLRNRNLIRLMKLCFPLFLHGILIILTPNVPKLFAKELCGEELLGFYTSVATPSVVVQQISVNIFNTALPLMSEQYDKKERRLYWTISKIQVIILAIGLLAALGFSALGEFALKLVFGNEIVSYSYLLIPTVIVSSLTAISYFLTSLFTVIQKNIMMVILETVCAGFAFIASPFFIKKYSLQGINLVLVFSYLIFIIAGYIFIMANVSRRMRGSDG